MIHDTHVAATWCPCPRQVIRARYYVMVLPAKREEMYIDGIRRMQNQALHQVIAALVTFGISAGSVVAPIISRSIAGWIDGV